MDAGEPAPVHWRFIPVLNPDGLLAPKPTRVNAGGVDLNRNFPTPGWAACACRLMSKCAPCGATCATG